MLIPVDHDPFHLPQALRALRREAKLSQRALAQRIGVAPATVARAETGEGDLRCSVFAKAVVVTGCGLTLLDGDGYPLTLGDGSRVPRDRGGRCLPAHFRWRRVVRFGDWWYDPWDTTMGATRPEWTYDVVPRWVNPFLAARAHAAVERWLEETCAGRAGPT